VNVGPRRCHHETVVTTLWQVVSLLLVGHAVGPLWPTSVRKRIDHLDLGSGQATR